FFFVNYESMKLSQQIAALATVPSAAMVNGDFRSLLSLPTPIRVRDPLTGQDFPTPNLIPANRITAIGRALMSQYPAETTLTPLGSQPASNYNFSEARTENLDIFSVRVDHQLSASDSLMFNYNYMSDPSFEPSNSLCGAATIPGFGCYTNQ